MAGTIIVLNGVPRSGKSSLAAAIQSASREPWIVLGVDHARQWLPESFQPGIGLRPGGERPELEPVVRSLFLALYGSMASHAREGLNVLADLGHHDCYRQPLGILPACAALVADLPSWFVGVRCPIEEIKRRRAATQMETDDARLQLWDRCVHSPGIYDIEIDTSTMTAEEGSAVLLALRNSTPTAFRQLAAKP